MSEITFDVHGAPAPQGSKWVGKHGNVMESSRALGPWRQAVRAEAQSRIAPGRMFAGAVTVSLTFRMKRPASHYRTGRNAHLLRDGAPRFPAGKPDIDKLARAVLDGLTTGGAFKDDSQVVALTVVKRYADRGEPTGCRIFIEDTEAPTP